MGTGGCGGHYCSDQKSESFYLRKEALAHSPLCQDQLDPSELSLKAAKNLPIRVEGFTWVKIWLFDHMLEQVGVVVTLNPVVSSVPIVLGMNVMKGLDLSRLLTEVEELCRTKHSCGL